jgi:hypothetical protein
MSWWGVMPKTVVTELVIGLALDSKSANIKFAGISPDGSTAFGIVGQAKDDPGALVFQFKRDGQSLEALSERLAQQPAAAQPDASLDQPQRSAMTRS